MTVSLSYSKAIKAGAYWRGESVWHSSSLSAPAILGTITGTMTARRGDLLSLAISLAALLMLALLAQLGRSI